MKSHLYYNFWRFMYKKCCPKKWSTPSDMWLYLLSTPQKNIFDPNFFFQIIFAFILMCSLAVAAPQGDILISISDLRSIRNI